MEKNYEDIINLPHHISTKHKQMSTKERAAQFAPFAALTGYGDAVKETARLTDKKIELNEELQKILDEELQIIKLNIKDLPERTFTYFVPDNKKNGGKYVHVTGKVKKIDEYEHKIILENGTQINISEIIDILTM